MRSNVNRDANNRTCHYRNASNYSKECFWYIHTNVDYLIDKMKILLENPVKAEELSRGAKEVAENIFNITRFTRDWMRTFYLVSQRAEQEKYKQV